jgi:hypothetical protein
VGTATTLAVFAVTQRQHASDYPVRVVGEDLDRRRLVAGAGARYRIGALRTLPIRALNTSRRAACT